MDYSNRFAVGSSIDNRVHVPLFKRDMDADDALAVAAWLDAATAGENGRSEESLKKENLAWLNLRQYPQ